MKKLVILLIFMLFASLVYAFEIIPPDMRVLQLVKNAHTFDEVTELWGVDYNQILQSDKTMTKQRVFELFKSMDPGKIKLADHEHLATVITVLEPEQLTLTFEARGTGSTKVPTAYYLIKLEEMKSNKAIDAD